MKVLALIQVGPLEGLLRAVLLDDDEVARRLAKVPAKRIIFDEDSALKRNLAVHMDFYTTHENSEAEFAVRMSPGPQVAATVRTRTVAGRHFNLYAEPQARKTP